MNSKIDNYKKTIAELSEILNIAVEDLEYILENGEVREPLSILK